MTAEERMVGLRTALRALYTPGDSVSAADRSAADSFLQAFLFSPDCWQLSLSLIRSPDAEFFEQLFCARALHQRLRCSVIKSVQTQASHQVITAEEWDKCREALVRPNKSLAQRALQSCLFRSDLVPLTLTPLAKTMARTDCACDPLLPCAGMPSHCNAALYGALFAGRKDGRLELRDDHSRYSQRAPEQRAACSGRNASRAARRS